MCLLPGVRWHVADGGVGREAWVSGSDSEQRTPASALSYLGDG